MHIPIDVYGDGGGLIPSLVVLKGENGLLVWIIIMVRER